MSGEAPSRKSSLGPLGRRVMEHLWASGPATVREVRDAVSWSGPDVAYTTVLTILVRSTRLRRYTRSRRRLVPDRSIRIRSGQHVVSA